MGHSSRSSSSRHAQMTSAGASSPLCAPQKQSSTISMPVLGLHTSLTPPRHRLPSSTQKRPRSPAGYKGAFCWLFEGRGRRRSCTERPLQSAELPGWKEHSCEEQMHPTPRAGRAHGKSLAKRSHPNHSAPSMRYLGIQHQKRLSLESSKSSASCTNGLSCEC